MKRYINVCGVIIDILKTKSHLPSEKVPQSNNVYDLFKVGWLVTVEIDKQERLGQFVRIKGKKVIQLIGSEKVYPCLLAKKVYSKNKTNGYILAYQFEN